MTICDLTIATGGAAMVKAAYSSGNRPYGVGAGNATVVRRRDRRHRRGGQEHAHQQDQNHGSGCSCDGNLLVDATVYDRFLDQLQKEGGYLAGAEEKAKLAAVMWDARGRRTLDTVARPARAIAAKAGFQLPDASRSSS